jgi:hypothetical protein
MIEHRIGNLLKQNDLYAFIHSANCQCTMGSGIAKEVREIYPEVYEADLKTKKGDSSKLGTFSFAKTKDGKIGYNLYGQDKYGYDGKCYTDYDAVKRGLVEIKNHIGKNIITRLKIGIPCKMCSTRGGASWDKIYQIIKDVFEQDPFIDVVICEFKEYSTKDDESIRQLRKLYKNAELMGNTTERDYEE